MTAELKTPDGQYFSVETKEELLWWQEKGLSFTASGYGRRIPTRYMVKFKNRWRRVYCCIYSNNGTSYIPSADGWIIVNSIEP
jgi:hypothetical protein